MRPTRLASVCWLCLPSSAAAHRHAVVEGTLGATAKTTGIMTPVAIRGRYVRKGELVATIPAYK